MLKLPTHVQLEITDVCNLRCKHCYHFDINKMPQTKDLSDGKVEKIAQMMVDAQIYSLVITGGEPLIRPELTMKIAEIAKKAGMFVSINTNLLLLTNQLANKLKKLEVDSLLVSCPASDYRMYHEVTRCGNYERLKNNLELLVDVGISCMVNMVVTPFNYGYIRSTASDMAKIGIKRFAATPASLNVEYPDYQELLNNQQTIHLLEDLRWCADNLGLEVDILEPLPKCFFPDWCWGKNYAFTKRACQAGRMSVSISNVGDIRPCSHNPNIYGNLFQENFETIWAKMSEYRNKAIPSICKFCPSISSCNGACRTNSLATTGLLDDPDRFIIGPMSKKQKVNEQKIEESSMVYFNGRLRSRIEIDGYSISSKSSHGNLIVVNKEMFDFVCWLEKMLPLSFEKLVRETIGYTGSEAFIKIIKLLLRKEFIYLI
jgi:radical SAM protein with 4Fe4S-binding SPASM domain